MRESEAKENKRKVEKIGENFRIIFLLISSSISLRAYSPVCPSIFASGVVRSCPFTTSIPSTSAVRTLFANSRTSLACSAAFGFQVSCEVVDGSSEVCDDRL